MKFAQKNKRANFLNYFLKSSSLESNASIDNSILFIWLLLMGIGATMVYSASIAYAANTPSMMWNQYYYFIRDLAFIAIGLVLAFVTFSKVKTSWLYDNYQKIAIFAVICLILVLIPHVGRVVNGSRRWIGFGAVNFQPSEFAKLSAAIYFSRFFGDYYKAPDKPEPKQIAIGFGLVGVGAALLLKEPDMGSATVVFVIWLSLLYLSGCSSKYILGMIGFACGAFSLLVMFSSYRLRRVTGFIDPWQDAYGDGYQLSHSLLAYGHGGWFGVGLGNSIEKLFYLPEAHTDFIMAVIAEEFGGIGVVGILFLFWIIFYRGFVIISNECKVLGRGFQALLAQGISIWFMMQAFVNVGVSAGILPTKGLTLPFISYGGSSLIINCIAIAILLKIDHENRLIKRGEFV